MVELPLTRESVASVTANLKARAWVEPPSN